MIDLDIVGGVDWESWRRACSKEDLPLYTSVVHDHPKFPSIGLRNEVIECVTITAIGCIIFSIPRNPPHFPRIRRRPSAKLLDSFQFDIEINISAARWIALNVIGEHEGTVGNAATRCDGWDQFQFMSRCHLCTPTTVKPCGPNPKGKRVELTYTCRI